MKTLFLMRHAKSDWATASPDHDRKLNKRGRRAADTMGRFLARIDQLPDLVVSSTAARCRLTTERAMRAGAWDCPARHDERIYEASVADLLAVAGDTEEEVEALMLVGHQPGMGSLLGNLVGGADVRFPTAAVARIEVDIFAWNEIAIGTGTLNWLLPPRLLDRREPQTAVAPPA